MRHVAFADPPDIPISILRESQWEYSSVYIYIGIVALAVIPMRLQVQIHALPHYQKFINHNYWKKNSMRIRMIDDSLVI